MVRSGLPLLLVEDEPTLRCTMGAILEFGDFGSDAVATGGEALERLRTRTYAAILLDLGLPDLDGAHLIRKIREVSEIPILVVSGRSAQQTAMLDLGADDFITKPFLPDELLARIRAVLRRNASRGERRADEGPGAKEEMPKAGTENPFRHGTLEARLFAFLADRPAELVPNEDLLDALWDERTDRAQNHLRVLIAKLRLRLRADARNLLIINEWGKGYRLVGRVGTVGE